MRRQPGPGTIVLRRHRSRRDGHLMGDWAVKIVSVMQSRELEWTMFDRLAASSMLKIRGAS
eukprot:SAG31_NODE_275_length_18666_cov_8.489309_13_plen_61_part_00